MPVELVPDLWPPISVDVLSPLAILRNQAGRLSGHTKGILAADVLTSGTDAVQTHTFQIVAPSLKGYRFNLFTVEHGRDMVYPVNVSFGPWQRHDRTDPGERIAPLGHGREVPTGVQPASECREADTTDAFVKMVGDLLTAPLTQSVIASLIAKSKDASTTSAA